MGIMRKLEFPGKFKGHVAKWVMRTYDFPDPQTPIITTAIPAEEKQNQNPRRINKLWPRKS